MTAVAANGITAWHVAEREEQFFKRLAWSSVLLFSALALSMSLVQLPKVARQELEHVPPRLARILTERQQLPAPAPKPPPPLAGPEVLRPQKSSKKPAERLPKELLSPPALRTPSTPQERLTDAREKAQRSGLLALQDDLADLRDNLNLDRLARPQGMERDIITAPRDTGSGGSSSARSLVDAGARSSSGGMKATALSSTSRSQVETKLAGRELAPVKSAISTESVTGSDSKGGTSVRKPGRTNEEVALIFQRHKSAIDALYNRALREDPTLQGKVQFELTIAGNGKVTDCRIVSSDLNAPELEKKILVLIKSFEFLSKETDTTTLSYSIQFLPS